MYQIAESYLFSEKLLPARSAFESASEMTSIPKIKEDALYNFAVISFEIDINPYDESVRAFENYLERYPNSPRKKDVYQYLINVYSSTSNYKKAIESLNKLSNLDVRLKRVYQTISYNHGVELFSNEGSILALRHLQMFRYILLIQSWLQYPNIGWPMRITD